MKFRLFVVFVAAGVLAGAGFLRAEAPRFRKLVLTDKYYCDGVTTADINRDGKADVVAGPFWWAGPDFQTATAFYEPEAFPTPPSPTNSMYSYAHDFNGDGWTDILVLGRVHKHSAYWYENPGGKRPGADGYWKKHFVFERVKGESPPLVDVDADGTPELIAHWEGRWGLIQPVAGAPTQPWRFRPITEQGDWAQFYHGTGVGDVNGDGRLDLLLNDGWWEQPADRNAAWTAHRHRFAERGGAQMFAYDVDGDGDNDIVTALDGHGWGLAWFEQIEKEGQIAFRRHMMMGDRSEEKEYGAAFSQVHALDMADVDGDGRLDIVTGKRRWAHGPDGDIEPNAPPVVYWFGLERTASGRVKFTPHKVDAESGVGVQITAADVNGDGTTDILTASKLGVFVFLQEGQ